MPCGNQEIVDQYSRRLARYGHDPRTLGWHKGRQLLRFEILLSMWNLDGASLLDFGCGFGDLYGFLRSKHVCLDYEGIDINPDLIAEGRAAYPSAKLHERDALRRGLQHDYDFIVASGVHNRMLPDNDEFIEQTFSLFDGHARRGFALNFMSNKAEYFEEDLYYADPAWVLSLAYRFSRRVTLRNDYMPFEFTVFVDKRESFDADSIVYSEFTHLVQPTNTTLQADAQT